MTYDELCDKIEEGEYNDYKDRVDVSIEISLIEYGILRNPETNETLFWINDCNNELPNDDHRIILKSCNISVDDVKDVLNDIDDGFFSFIGSSKEKELNELDNNHLSFLINSINSWNGYFNH